MPDGISPYNNSRKSALANLRPEDTVIPAFYYPYFQVWTIEQDIKIVSA